MLMRATQLGLFSDEKLRKIANNQTRELLLSKEEMDGLDKKVCEQLDQFMARETWAIVRPCN